MEPDGGEWEESYGEDETSKTSDTEDLDREEDVDERNRTGAHPTNIRSVLSFLLCCAIPNPCCAA